MKNKLKLLLLLYSIFAFSKVFAMALLHSDPATYDLHEEAKRGATYKFKALINYVPAQEVIQEKRKKAVALLCCFKRFEKGEGLGVKIPKGIRRMLCKYCTPGIANIDALVDKKIATLRKLFSVTYNGKTVRDIADDECKYFFNIRHIRPFLAIMNLTDLKNLDQQRPAIRANIIKALQETPLRPVKKAKHEN